jgi:hypothetical protein
MHHAVIKRLGMSEEFIASVFRDIEWFITNVQIREFNDEKISMWGHTVNAPISTV